MTHPVLITILELIPDDAARRFWMEESWPEGVTAQDIANELSDYHTLIENVPRVYMEVTGGRMSKPSYKAAAVIAEFNDYVDGLVEERVKEALEDYHAKYGGAGVWSVIWDGDSLAMIQLPDGRILGLQQLGKGGQMWGNAPDNDLLCAKIVRAVNGVEDEPEAPVDLPDTEPEFELTEEHVRALRRYADDHGPRWKDQLADDWWTGRDANRLDGHLLRQIRNNLGPEWLAVWRMPE